MADHVIHIPEEVATRKFAGLMARVCAGVEVVIESDPRAVAVLPPAAEAPGRLLSGSIAMAEAHAKELGHEPTMDPDFAARYLEEIIGKRKPRET